MDSKEKRQKYIVMLVCMIFVCLAGMLWLLPAGKQNLDSIILLFLQGHVRNRFLTPILIGITTLGNAGAIWILITIGLCIPKKTRRIGIISACALLGSLLINNLILKNLAGRIRPYEAIDGLMPLIAKPLDASFPSGHTGCAFASAWVLLRNLPKRFGIPAVLLAALIGFSRLYVGVHYPTDVLVGMINGIGIAYLAEMLTGYYRKNKSHGNV